MQIDLEPSDYGQGDSSYRAAGGEQSIRELVGHFYRVMSELPEAARIRAMHPSDLTVSEDKLALFLCGWLGGPRLFQSKYGPISIPGVHSHLVVNEPERDAWLFCMRLALEEMDYADDFKAYLLKALSVPAERIRLVARD